jgi:hypothetical protein
VSSVCDIPFALRIPPSARRSITPSLTATPFSGRATRPPENPGNPTANFHGETHRNDTHQPTTDPDAQLARKGQGKEAKLS